MCDINLPFEWYTSPRNFLSKIFKISQGGCYARTTQDKQIDM